jgi:hypothetical protein
VRQFNGLLAAKNCPTDHVSRLSQEGKIKEADLLLSTITGILYITEFLNGSGLGNQLPNPA